MKNYWKNLDEIETSRRAVIRKRGLLVEDTSDWNTVDFDPKKYLEHLMRQTTELIERSIKSSPFSTLDYIKRHAVFKNGEVTSNYHKWDRNKERANV